MLTPADLEAKMHTDNLNTWLELEAVAMATSNQRERYASGVLPPDELAGLARGQLFAPFSVFKRWRKIEAHHVRHARSHEVSQETITYAAVPLATLSAYDWDALSMFNTAVARANQHDWLVRSGASFGVVTRQHTATCGICKAYRREHSVLLTVVWAGRSLSREYRLEVPA